MSESQPKKQSRKERNSERSKLSDLGLPPELHEVFLSAAREAAGKPLSIAPGSPFARAMGVFVEHALNAEMGDHLGYDRHERVEPEDPSESTRRDNPRNGHSRKTLKTSMGSTEIKVPRDRAGTFEPQIIPKHGRMTDEIQQRVISMYSQGMTTRDIAAHVRELYHFSASENFVSDLVERIEPELVAWRNRQLEAVYPIIYVDAIHSKVRHSNGVCSTAAYIVSGYGEGGTHDVLGVWIAPSTHSNAHGESASYWHTVLEELRSRGVEDVLIATSDALSGLDLALETVFPRAQHIPCIVHQMRQSLKLVGSQQRKQIASELKKIYQAPSYEAAELELAEISARHADRHPRVIKQWRDLLPRLTVLWTMSRALRKMVYTTNPLENINRQIRKVTKNRSVFPNIESALRLLTLVLMRIDRGAKERRARPDWTPIVNELHIHYGERLPHNWGQR